MSTLVQHMHKKAVPTAPTRTHAHKDIDYVAVIGRIAAVMSVVMYVSYITQISNNLAGHPGTPWQPLAAFANCVFWSLYGFLKPQKDIPILVANIPGIFLALITFITTFIH